MSTNGSNENIDCVKEYVKTLDHIISVRNSLVELLSNNSLVQGTTWIQIGIEEVQNVDDLRLDVGCLGQGKVVDFLIGACNNKINELKKNISDALYPTIYKDR